MRTGVPCGNWLTGSSLWAVQSLGLQCTLMPGSVGCYQIWCQILTTPWIRHKSGGHIELGLNTSNLVNLCLLQLNCLLHHSKIACGGQITTWTELIVSLTSLFERYGRESLSRRHLSLYSSPHSLHSSQRWGLRSTPHFFSHVDKVLQYESINIQK